MFSIATCGWVIFIINVDVDDNDVDNAAVDDNADVDDKDVDDGQLCVLSTSMNNSDIWNEFQLFIWIFFTRTEYLT